MLEHFRFQPNSGRHWDKSFPKNSCTVSKKSFCTFREQILLTAHNISGKGKYLNWPGFFQKPCSKIISRFKTVTHRIQLTKRYFHVSCICRYLCRFLVYISLQFLEVWYQKNSKLVKFDGWREEKLSRWCWSKPRRRECGKANNHCRVLVS